MGQIRNKIRNMPCGHLLILFLLLVDAVLFGDWVEFLGLVLLAWVFFNFIIKTSVVHVAFANAFGVTSRYELYE